MHVSSLLLVLAVVSANQRPSSSSTTVIENPKDYSIVNKSRWRVSDHCAIGYPLTDCILASDTECIDAIVARYGVERTARSAYESINTAVQKSDIKVLRHLMDTFDGVYRVQGMTCRPFIVESAAKNATTEVFAALLSYYENYKHFEGEPLMWALRYAVLENRLDNVAYVIETYSTNSGFKVAVASTMSWAVSSRTCFGGLSVLLDYIEPRLEDFELALKWTIDNGTYESALPVLTYILDRLHSHQSHLQKHLCTALQGQSWASSTKVIEFIASRYSAEYLARGWRGLLIKAARRGTTKVVDLVIQHFLAPHPELGGKAVHYARGAALRHRHAAIAAALTPYELSTNAAKSSI